MKLSRLLTLGLLLVVMMSLGFTIVSAQEDVTMIIGWEQEPDLPEIISGSAFSEYLDEFYARDVWDWKGEAREIFPVMVEEIPSLENGLVTTVPVTGDFDGDGTEEEAEAPVVTYKLREGMLWSDGKPVTADDCMFWHNLMTQPDALDSVQRGFYPEVVESAEKIDDLTVQLTYNTPWPEFLLNATLSCAYPAHKFLGDNSAGFTMDSDGDGVFDANLDESPYALGFQNPAELVGYGPYVMSEYNVGQGLTFTLNPNWGINEFETVPAITTVILQFILESAQMENAMSVGDIDLAFNFDAANNGYGDMADVSTFTVPGVYMDAIWLNSGPGSLGLSDVRVREAIYSAIDRRSIANQFAGEGAADQIPATWYPQQFTSPEAGFVEYDVENARALLTEAGWVDDNADEGTADAPTPRISQGVENVPDGTSLVLRFYTTPVVPRPDMQTIIQGQLAQVGVATQLFVVNGPTVLFAPFNSRGILYTGQYDIAIYALSNTPISLNGSPDNFYCRGIPSQENPEGRNNTWFCNEEHDSLDALVSTTLDPDARLEASYERSILFQEAMVWGGLRPRPTAYAVRTDRFDFASIDQNVGTLSGNYFQSFETWQPAS